MIVRINQFDAPRPEAEAGWPTDGPLGPLITPWPADTRAYEILILDQDAQPLLVSGGSPDKLKPPYAVELPPYGYAWLLVCRPPAAGP